MAAGSGHRVIAAHTKWVASRKPADGQPTSVQRPVSLQRFHGVRRTARHESARRWQQGRQRDLITAHQKNQHPPHHSRSTPETSLSPIRVSSRRSSANVTRYATARARMMTSSGPIRGRISNRAISRNRRFSRFRATADSAYLGTMNPTRPSPSPRPPECPRGEAIHRSSRLSVRIRFPSRVTRSISARRVNRCGRANRRRSGARVLRRKPNGQPLPTLLATPTQYLTPPPRRHPLQKSVRANPALVPRTIRWLAHVLTPIRVPFAANRT